MNLKDRFDTLARQWAEHCQQVRFSSTMNDYLDHPAYGELVDLGTPALPWIMARYPKESLPWGFVLQEITGIRIIEDPNEFSPPQVRQKWLDWWSEQQRRLPSAVANGTSSCKETQ
jgi:hypothetical protein